MANPRQRRKSRSGTAKVKSSNRQQSKLRKVDPRGPEAFVKAWDKHQTPRQNWARLGIMGGKLGPKLSGGVERKMDKDEYWVNRAKRPDEFELDGGSSAEEGEEDGVEEEDMEDEDGEDELVEPSASRAPTVTSASLGKNEGRIIRDADGKVIQIIVGNDDAAPLAWPDVKGKAKAAPSKSKPTPWGAPMEELEDVQAKNEGQMAANEGVKAQKSRPVTEGIAYDATSRVGPAKTALLDGPSCVSWACSDLC